MLNPQCQLTTIMWPMSRGCFLQSTVDVKGCSVDSCRGNDVNAIRTIDQRRPARMNRETTCTFSSGVRGHGAVRARWWIVFLLLLILTTTVDPAVSRAAPISATNPVGHFSGRTDLAAMVLSAQDYASP